MSNIGIVLVPRALIVFGPMLLPVAEAHPTEIVLTVVALHVITTAILLDDDVALGAVFRVRRNVIRRFAIIRALCQPFLDHQAVCWCMIIHSTSIKVLISV